MKNINSKLKTLPSVIKLDTGTDSFDLVTEKLGPQTTKEILDILNSYRNNDNSEFTVSIILKHNPTNTYVEMKSYHNSVVPYNNKCTFDGFRSIDIKETISQGIIELVSLMPEPEKKNKNN